MREQYLFFILTLLGTVGAFLSKEVPDSKKVFDQKLYESVLDPEVCEEQLSFIVNNTGLLLIFLDAGIRLPRGFFEGNRLDMGNYHQCLGISRQAANIPDIEGKYCAIKLPLNQNIHFPEINLSDIDWPEGTWPEQFSRGFNEENFNDLKINHNLHEKLRFPPSESTASGPVFELAVCIPKACSIKQFFEGLLINATEYGFEYEELFCRLPNDKQWVAGDYVAIAIFSFLGLLVSLSTAYDVYQTRILEKDPKTMNKIYASFSVITNTRRLITFTPVPGAIECIDGIRSLAMLWVVVGHTYVTQLMTIVNPIEIVNWTQLPRSVLITMAPITVDTFFMLTGLLLVFTNAGKMTGMKLIKNLHLFYLNRLLRMFPLLAAFVLLQATILNRIFDGPHWTTVQGFTENCRMYWWSTLLHVQNYVTTNHMCLPHTWYLAIDVQLYILSPIVLFFVLSKKTYKAWIALCTALLSILVASTIYNFINNFQGGSTSFTRPSEDSTKYTRYYYKNTLTRASPFFVGMVFGYILHLHRGQKLIISKLSAITLWSCFAIIMGGITYLSYSIIQPDWDNQTMDNSINSFMRPAWAMSLGWLIVACVHGYGGPINWLLSLSCWKIISRLSYGIYIVHYPLQFLVNSSVLSPVYFNPTGWLLKFISDFGFALVFAYALSMLVDSPCSVLIKHFLGGTARSKPPVKVERNRDETVGTDNAAFEDTERNVKNRLSS